ncbi:putative multidrug resistance protein CDR1 [Rosellinia necatrix]|uniref:Putative multidrug resistance protein CDR1 n=1 Tax=Rosellinia necatrix TaxID=77044 RepID=A0A1S7UPS5_ROSNE|nr:putative multidrug resistance protein CDR1 [Rosellinia necatrix]
MSSTEHQTTFLSYVLAIPRLFLRVLSQGNPQKLHIIDGLDGLLLPGEMLLVLGRPGSGCSTFLKTLGGVTRSFNMKDAGAINYQGIGYHEMHTVYAGECIYVAELDVHFPELKLGETIEFVAKARGAHPQGKDSSWALSEDVLSLFRLEQSANTHIGDANIRGLSGGEKRRTSLAEALVQGAQLQCWDNSVRGLDSLSALRFVKLLKKQAQALQTTTLVTLYQASDAMLENFDNVTLLYEGRQIFFGPIDSAADYFIQVGFFRPTHSTLADFLTSITNPEERIVRAGFEGRVPRSPDDFARTWKQSQERRDLFERIETFNSIYPLNETKKPEHLGSNTYPLAPFAQVRLCMERVFLRLRNNPSPSVAALISNAILGVVVGSVYFRLDETSDSLDQRATLLFFSLLNSAFTPAFEVLTMWAQRPIVEKHKSYALYRPFTEAIASMICDLPQKLLILVFFNIPLYFMTNLRLSAAAFFTYLLFTFVTILTMSMLFRTVGSLSRSLEQTLAPNSTIILLCIIYTGFVIPQKYMVPWLGWFRFINPLFYAYESLMINEYRGREFPCGTVVPSGPEYEQFGMQAKICSVIGSQFGQVSVKGDNYLAVKYGYHLAHEWRNLPILLALMIALCAIHLIGTELVPADQPRGEVLLFPRRHANFLRGGRRDERANSALFAQDISGSRFEASRRIKVGNEIRNDKIQRHESSLFWHDLRYEIRTKKRVHTILGGIEGWVRPGTLTALMGVTGAGKTSLLNVLADRITIGVVTGDISITSQTRDESFGRLIGYAQQEDIHLATATVREALEFSAILRQHGNSSMAEKMAYVDTILDMLDMTAYQHAVVGVPGEGLNIEQRKRLTIAVELVAKPKLLLFLDEPTSGLDSQTAWSICTLLRKLADNGQAVLCTIHQPNSGLFQMFDNLLLLQKGGRQLYFGPIGPNASTVLGYFHERGAPRCPSGANPAEWIMETTSESEILDEKESWSQKWEDSQQRQAVLRHITELRGVGESQSSSPDYSKRYAAGLLVQLRIVTVRLFKDHWRDPVYLYSKLALCIGISLANGISFYKPPLDMQGLITIVFSIFLITQLFSPLGQQMIPKLAVGRSIYESRERSNRSYSWVVFLASNVMVELFWQTLGSILFFIIWYYPTGLYRYGDNDVSSIDRGGLVFVLVWLFCLWTSTLSQALGASLDAPELAVQLSTLLFFLSLIFCGVLVFPEHLPSFWIFVYRASPFTYLINGLIVTSLANTKITCSAAELLHLDLPLANGTCGDYLTTYAMSTNGYVDNPDSQQDCLYCPLNDTTVFLDSIGMQTANDGRYAGYVAVYVVFNILAMFALYWIARVPKKKKAVLDSSPEREA